MVALEYKLPYPIELNDWQVDFARDLVADGDMPVDDMTNIERRAAGHNLVVEFTERESVPDQAATAITNHLQSYHNNPRLQQG